MSDPLGEEVDGADAELGRLDRCLQKIREGDPHAISEFFNTYLERSVQLAKSQLEIGEARLIDEEVAAVSAIESLIIRVRGGDYADVNDHVSLWNLLALIIHRKLIKYRRRMYRPKRSPENPIVGVDDVTGDSSWGAGVSAVDQNPPAISSVIAEETLAQILKRLSDNEASSVLLLRLEGYSDVEIAEKLQHTRNWVQRRNKKIRRIAESLLREDA